MTLKRATIFVYGNVQMAGFRTFVKNFADSLDIKGYAENLPDGRVRIVCEGEEKRIAGLINSIKIKAPSLSKVEDLQTEYEEYVGEFADFERRGKDVPRKATLDDLLEVMISFDNKAEKMVGVLGGINKNTEKMLEKQDMMLEKQDMMLEKQDMMLEKQDITIDVLKSVKEDTAQIPRIVENTGRILEHTSHIPAMKEDTAAIRYDTKEIATKLWEKYEELSKEIAQMKITLSKIEAKVFS
jgi:acylphosphatase